MAQLSPPEARKLRRRSIDQYNPISASRRKVMSFLADRAFQDRFVSALNAHPNLQRTGAGF
jgi:hypothetical protein